MQTINVYQFDELSEEAKEVAIKEYRSSGFEYHWGDESHESLKAFCTLFGIKVKNGSLAPGDILILKPMQKMPIFVDGIRQRSPQFLNF